MMFDPPDFPYNELSDTMRDHYGPDDLLFSNNLEPTIPLPSMNKNLTDVTEQIISNVESQLMLNSNDSGRYFSVENATYNIENIQNAELFVVQSDMFNYESTLLDDNTVNQFLLPLQGTESNGPDLLALHSCVICHEIFTTDADLLDHTVLVHASDNSMDPNQNTLQPIAKDSSISQTETYTTSSTSFETEWLICGVCGRVLSTALEVEPSEQLCCSDLNGKSNVDSRRLDTMFVCDFCSGLFADGDAIDSHRLTCFAEDQPGYFETDTGISSEGPSYPEPFFKCDTCGQQTVTADELRRHVVDVHLSKKVTTKAEKRVYTASNNNKMWNCGSCNQLFATARELYRHKRGEDRPPGAPLTAYVCEECDKVLGSMCALHTHKKMHKVSKPGYPCRICGRRFNQSGHLAIHMRMHTGERPYPCDLCPKAFKVKVERDDHRRTHTGERPFACTACPKTFTAAARLREHARIHTDQRPYRCDICGAAFRRPYARTVHTLIHTGEKPHECDICGTAFRRSGDMWKHKRTLHGIHANNIDDK